MDIYIYSFRVIYLYMIRYNICRLYIEYVHKYICIYTYIYIHIYAKVRYHSLTLRSADCPQKTGGGQHLLCGRVLFSENPQTETALVRPWGCPMGPVAQAPRAKQS